MANEIKVRLWENKFTGLIHASYIIPSEHRGAGANASQQTTEATVAELMFDGIAGVTSS